MSPSLAAEAMDTDQMPTTATIKNRTNRGINAGIFFMMHFSVLDYFYRRRARLLPNNCCQTQKLFQSAKNYQLYEINLEPVIFVNGKRIGAPNTQKYRDRTKL
jgi:hypothetical protein